jgi:hypothetical protein
MELPPLARKLQEHFYLVQIGLGGTFLLVYWLFFRPKEPESNFRVREADRPAGTPTPGAAKDKNALANAKLKLNVPLRLGGIRIDGPPHETLGVSPTASVDEIQRAYRELMKRYHPDAIGRPGSREWQDAQKIAEAINLARNELLKRRKG